MNKVTTDILKVLYPPQIHGTSYTDEKVRHSPRPSVKPTLRRPMRVLSIDWDYFVETDDAKLDWGHGDGGPYHELLWTWRRVQTIPDPAAPAGIRLEPVDLTKVVPLVGEPLRLAFLPFRARPYHLTIAESHQAILTVLAGARDLDIWNVDAHHDLYYGAEPCATTVDADCGSWGSALISEGRVRSWTQLYPDWREQYPEGHDDKLAWARKQLGRNFHTGRGFARLARVPSFDLVFVCRSGGWTPPEYDVKLNLLLGLLGATRDKLFPIRSTETPKALPGLR